MGPRPEAAAIRPRLHRPHSASRGSISGGAGFPKVKLPGLPWSPEFMAAYEERP